jgi:methyl-accepting chemotaxis protein
MSMLKNIRLKPKMIGGFVLIAMITVIMGFIGYRNMSLISEQLHDVGQVHLPAIDNLRIIATQLESIRAAVYALLNRRLSNEEFARQLANVDKARAIYREAWDKYEALPREPQEAILWKEFSPLIDAWRQANNEFFNEAKHLDEIDMRNPAALQQALLSFRGDQYKLEVNIQRLIDDNQSFEGGADPTACSFGKWSASFTTRNKELGKLLEEIKPFHEQLHRSAGTIKEKMKTGDREGARKLFLEELYPATEKTHEYFDAMMAVASQAGVLQGNMVAQAMGTIQERQAAALGVLQKLITYNEEAIAKTDQEAAGVQKKANLSLLASIVVGFAAALVLGIMLSLSIVNPIGKTVATVLKVSEGDMTQQIQVDQKDEVGQLATAMNNMTAKLREIIKELTQNSSTLAAASEELSATSTQLASGAEEMNSQSRTVASAGEQLSSNVNTMAAASEEMSSSAGAVASAIEEMSSSINEVAKNCEKESRIAHQANEQAGQTRQIMAKLGDSAKEIGKIVEVISGIADQTNLLALNATIEAASAGEAGKGFAVVANEVKELARQSAQATEQIAKQIETMQGNTDTAIKAIEEITKIIEEVSSISGTIAAAVEEQSATTNEIAKTVSGVSSATNEMAKNIQESAKGANEVSKNIQGVNAASQQVAAGATQTNASAQELAKIAARLKEMVGQFKV